MCKVHHQPVRCSFLRKIKINQSSITLLFQNAVKLYVFVNNRRDSEQKTAKRTLRLNRRKTYIKIKINISER